MRLTIPLETKVRQNREVMLYAVGVVSPNSENLETFLKNIRNQSNTLTPLSEFHSGFMVGKPSLNFEAHRDWICQRHPPSRFSQLSEKGGFNVKATVSACINALEAQPNLEKAIKKLDTRVWIGVASCFGDVDSYFTGLRSLQRAEKKWNHFWASVEKNRLLREYLDGKKEMQGVPISPNRFALDTFDREEANEEWNKFWTNHSIELKEFVNQFSDIESQGITGDVNVEKLQLIRQRAKQKKQLLELYQCPTPPWESVEANSLWNIPNVPASQLSMLLGTHGPALGYSAACASFGVALEGAMNAIQGGEADLAIVGSADIPPNPTLTSAFYNAKVLSAGESVSMPLTKMRGTHMSGGAVVWILGHKETMTGLGVSHLGVKVLSVGLSSDAEHIITPSQTGPHHCIFQALQRAGIDSKHIHSWDMHATGTPGDWNELQMTSPFLSEECLISARKGLFGHAMGTAGGLELTAQLLGPKVESSDTFWIPGCGIPSADVHPSFLSLGHQLILDKPRNISTNGKPLLCGKLSMGIGGISSCVLAQREFRVNGCE
jgi:3-oxoacyl-[acyl-carrier-protein] synthase II